MLCTPSGYLVFVLGEHEDCILPAHYAGAQKVEGDPPIPLLQLLKQLVSLMLGFKASLGRYFMYVFGKHPVHFGEPYK